MAPPTTQQTDDACEIRTVSLISLGCPKNLVDSERMLGELASCGLVPVSYNPADDSASSADDHSAHAAHEALTNPAGPDHAIEPADAVIVNTCGFLEASKQESLAVIRQAIAAKERGLVKRVVVAGCLVQRHRAKLFDWAPGIDAMVGVFDRDRIVQAVRGTTPTRDGLTGDEPRYWIAGNALVAAKERGLATASLTVNGKDGKGVGYFEDDSARLRLTPRHYAYLRVSEGCNQNCAFCTIPSIRGKMRSKPIDKICAEAGELIRDGAFELLLIGQDTTSFGDDIGIGLGQTSQGQADKPGGLPLLLRSISETVQRENGSGWVRLMYAYPSNFSDPIVDAFASLCQDGHLIPYLDIPLQHASDSVLDAMRRNVKAEQQRQLMLTLRERIPGMALRTTFITGFPGETQSDHEQLLEFIEEIGFDAMGVFQYSAEPGTVAGTMAENPALVVPPEIMQQRYDELMALQQRIAHEQAAFLAEQFDPADPDSGVRFDVLIDEKLGREADDDRPDSSPKSSPAAWISKGRCYFQAPQIDAITLVRSKEALSPGELVRCTIVGSDGYDLIAQPSADLARTTSLPILGA